MAEQPESSGGKSKLGGGPNFPDPFECTAIGPITCRLGLMCSPPNRNGNMPAVQERPRHTHGETTIASSNANYNWDGGAMTETTLNRLVMSGNMLPTRGAFLICTEMSGSGPRTGTKRLIPPATRWWIQPDRHRARLGSYGVVPGTSPGRPCVQLSAATTPGYRDFNHRLPCWFPKKPVMKKRGKSWPEAEPGQTNRARD